MFPELLASAWKAPRARGDSQPGWLALKDTPAGPRKGSHRPAREPGGGECPRGTDGQRSPRGVHRGSAPPPPDDRNGILCPPGAGRLWGPRAWRRRPARLRHPTAPCRPGSMSTFRPTPSLQLWPATLRPALALGQHLRAPHDLSARPQFLEASAMQPAFERHV